MPPAPVGTRIAKRRHVLGLSQKELAGLVGVSRDAVSMWENDRHFPHRHLGKLEQVLGVDLTGEAAPDPNEGKIRRGEQVSFDSLPPELRAKLAEAYRQLMDGEKRQRAG